MSGKHHTLSPSAFPAWEHCPAFNPDPTETEYAAEGTKQHKALAALLHGDGEPLATLSQDARESVEWAARYVFDKVDEAATERDRAPIETERRLRHVDEDGKEVYFGTADAVSGNLLFDYKSGDDTRDYRAQLAGYALALFDLLFDCERVACHLLYGRIRRVNVFTFTREEAAAIVYPILRARADANRNPTPCDWCGYCADRLTCPALTVRAVAVAEAREDWKGELPAIAHPSKITDPGLMAKALTLARFVSEWCDSVKHHALELAKTGAAIPGFTLQERRGTRTVEDLNTAYARTGLEPAAFLGACKLSLPKLAEAYAEAKGLKKAAAAREVENLLADLITEAAPTLSLVRERGAGGGTP